MGLRLQSAGPGGDDSARRLMDAQQTAALLDLLGRLADRAWNDPAKRGEIQAELLRMLQAGELQTLEPQLAPQSQMADLSRQDALSDSLFKSGWRPYCGWVCGVGLSYQFLLRPLLNGLALGNFPSLEVDTLMTLLFGILGLGVYRTIEKVRR
ncbi:hypothetical protein DK843_07445 [Chromobacterium phragmitis]|uniref:Holin of 3TMs, for gene-transfer release n=2 Tax=Chromobacterium phragmitis TaxID=2202141 RepID=A0A344UFV3_9NEIS|nr:hypothetical protein DK843_07445 [Chromobacterium phragmitis]